MTDAERQPHRGRVRRAGPGRRHRRDGQGRRGRSATRWPASTPTWPTPTCSRISPIRWRTRTPSCRGRRRGSSTTCSPTSAARHEPGPSRPAVVYAGARDPRRRTSRPGSGPGSSTASPTPTASAARSRRRCRPSREPLVASGEPDGQPALGRQRLDDLQQQGQAGPPVRAVLQRHARLRVRRDASASARSCSTTRSSAWSPRCTRTTPMRRWSSTRGGKTTWDVNDTSLPTARRRDPRTDPDIQGLVAGYFASQDAAWPTWYQQRIRGALGAQRAARRRAGRTPREHAHHRPLRRPGPPLPDGRAQRVRSRMERRPSIPPAPSWTSRATSARCTTPSAASSCATTTTCSATAIHQASMEAGERWMLNDVTGKPIHAWDSRGHRVPHRVRRAAPSAWQVYRAGRRPADRACSARDPVRAGRCTARASRTTAATQPAR